MIDHAAMLRPRARLRHIGYLSALAILLGAAAVGHMAYLAQQEALALAQDNEGLRRRLAAADALPSPHDAELQRHWTVLKQERAFPWARVFRSIEHVTDPDIELLEFRPDRRQGTLVLKGEGRSAESVMRYLERLQDDPAFSRVYLAHTSTVERGRLLTREFELRLNLDSRQFAMR
jgi:Tfp pilus assembly protein PilN